MAGNPWGPYDENSPEPPVVIGSLALPRSFYTPNLSSHESDHSAGPQPTSFGRSQMNRCCRSLLEMINLRENDNIREALVGRRPILGHDATVCGVP